MSASLAGAALGASTALAVAVAICVVNPWFMDAPALWLAAVSAPLTALGAAAGSLVRRASPRPSGVALALAIVGVLALPAWPRPAPTGDVRLLVYGIDGATWDVIDPLRDRLPTIDALRARGGAATLRSMEPLFSPLLWTTMATGRRPEAHGIHGFHVHATDCRAARFWDVMHAQGLRVGTWKWLVTWPPTRIGAFQVPAWLAPEPDAWPERLRFVKELELSNRMRRKQVAARRGYAALAADGVANGMRLSTLARGVRAAALRRFWPDPLRDGLEGQLLRVQIDRDVAIATIHATNPEVVTFTDYATDAVGHRYWRYREPASFPGTDPALVARWGAALDEAYLQADAVLADLLDAVGPQARVVVLSDHGQKAVDGGAGGHLLTPKTERLAARLAAEVGPVDVSRLGHKLVVALKAADPVAQRGAVEAWIAAVRVDRTGNPVFRAEPGLGDDARSLGLAIVEDGLSPERLGADRAGGEPLGAFLGAEDGYSGDHHDRGVWISAGPGLASGALPELSILDVAPTLLALVGLPAAADVEGRAPPALWASAPPELPAGPPTWDDLVPVRSFTVLPEGSAGVNEEMLEALGYVAR